MCRESAAQLENLIKPPAHPSHPIISLVQTSLYTFIFLCEGYENNLSQNTGFICYYNVIRGHIISSCAIVPPSGHVAVQLRRTLSSLCSVHSLLLLLQPDSPCDPFSGSCYFTSSFSCGLFTAQTDWVIERVEDGGWARPAHQGAISLHHLGYFDKQPGQSEWDIADAVQRKSVRCCRI